MSTHFSALSIWFSLGCRISRRCGKTSRWCGKIVLRS